MSDGSVWVEMVQALPQLHLSDEANAGSYSYKYASLPSILETIRPTLSEHGWAVTQDVTTGDNGQPQVTTLFDHRGGEQRRYGPLTVPASGSGSQAVGSAITYARRYALVAALGLAPDGDDDGAAASETPQAKSAHEEAWEAVYHIAGDDNAKAMKIWRAAKKWGSTIETQADVDAVVAAAREFVSSE